MQTRRRTGFTLVELLVVIGVIALLISILLPALEKARDSANAIKCAANLRSIGQAMFAYIADNDEYLPAAYTDRDAASTNGTPTYGYAHWSSFLFGPNPPPGAFTCPAMAVGGHSPADPPAGDYDPGQTPEPADSGANDGFKAPITATDGTNASNTYTVDDQAPRMAYTLNEAICGRNKSASSSPTRQYRNVRISIVENQPTTILATEFIDAWPLLSFGASTVSKSYLPVQPWRPTGTGMGVSSIDITGAAAGVTNLRMTAATDFYTKSDGTQSLKPIDDYYAGKYNFSSVSTLLDQVGRNHGRGEYYVDNKSNFLYLDGHVELKNIRDTVPPNNNGGATQPAGVTWEWGKFPYSTNG